MIYRNLIVVVLVVAALAGAGLYSLPYIRIYQTLSALQEDDRERLNRFIDFAGIRAGIQEQVRTSISAPSQDAPASRIGQAIMAQVLEQTVEQMLSPEGAASLFRKSLAQTHADRPGPPAMYRNLKIFLVFLGAAEFSYASPAEFIMACKDRQNRIFRFLWRRNGLDWRLYRVEIPDNGREKRK